jgi:quinolinate synthase
MGIETPQKTGRGSMKEDIRDQIARLKKERDAVILAHNYQLSEVQDIADFTGDSLELARRGAEVPQKVVVFCGVHFMAETCAMMSPEKTVLLPDETSGCPMADMADGEGLRALKKKHPGAVVVCYVNSTAEVKALSDVCCTSSNAVSIVNRIPLDKEIIFVPDKYLGGHVSRVTGRELILWDGFCPTHALLIVEHIENARAAYPGAPVIVHPESAGSVCVAADEALSTGQMCAYAKNSHRRHRGRTASPPSKRKPRQDIYSPARRRPVSEHEAQHT